MERLRQKDILEREKFLMTRQIKELEEEDKRALELKRIPNEILAKEVEESNKRAIGIKQRRKLKEKEVDLKIHQFNIEKTKNEEEELAEKRRIQEEKEREVQRLLRENQERFQNKQAELDAIRAKRAYDQTERAARERERKEIEVRVNYFWLIKIGTKSS
jgi:hypothetical protein